MSTELTATLITAVVTLIVAAWSIGRQLKRDKQDGSESAAKNAGVISESALSLVIPMKEKIKELEGELERLNVCLDEFEKRIRAKDEQVRSLEKRLKKSLEDVVVLVLERDSLKELLRTDYLKGKG